MSQNSTWKAYGSFWDFTKAWGGDRKQLFYLNKIFPKSGARLWTALHIFVSLSYLTVYLLSSGSSECAVLWLYRVHLTPLCILGLIWCVCLNRKERFCCCFWIPIPMAVPTLNTSTPLLFSCVFPAWLFSLSLTLSVSSCTFQVPVFLFLRGYAWFCC